MNKIVLIIIIVTMVTTTYSQQSKFGLETGIGFYRMNELEYLNTRVQKDLPFNTKLVSDFPPYLFYRPYLQFTYDIIGWGFRYSFLSTGSRVSGYDYSGEYRFDMLVKSHTPSLFVNFKLNKYLVFNIDGGTYFSTLKINEFFILNNEKIADDDIIFKARNFYTEPSIAINYTYNKFDYGFKLGYSFQFKGKGLHLKDDKDMIMEDNREPNWSGLRFGLFINYNN